MVSVLNGYAGQADLVAKLDRSLSQAECRVSVAASSHAIDVGMRHDEESQKQILVLIRRQYRDKEKMTGRRESFVREDGKRRAVGVVCAWRCRPRFNVGPRKCHVAIEARSVAIV